MGVGLELRVKFILEDGPTYTLHHRTSEVLRKQNSGDPDWNEFWIILKDTLNSK